jgi:D-serine deaminase-like pyridoxal phosphate-dependent protein
MKMPDPVIEAQSQVAALEAAALQTDAANQRAQEALRAARQTLADAQAALAAQVAAGTARAVSIIDNASFTERQAGKAAVIAYVKANPGCSAADAIAAWNAGALAARPADRQWLLMNTEGLLEEYAANLLAAGIITDQSWPTMAGWIVATPAAVIMAS